MRSEQGPSEFLSQDSKPSLQRSTTTISQEDLQNVELLEDAAVNAQTQIYQKLKKGASVEPGRLRPDVRGFAPTLQRIIKHVDPSMPISAPPAARDESDPNGGLTFSELRALRDFQILGRFQPAVLRSIVDRLEILGKSRFDRNRERMSALECFNIGSWLQMRIKFAYRTWRVRRLIRLHELGFTQFKSCILSGILSINRDYFAIHVQPS